jgi:hypothetical protein
MVKAFLVCLSLYATAMPLLPQDVVIHNSSPTASLIELYTSEGCSSCPPAEAWINNLKSDPGLWKEIFPVAFHVDYWDGLGWPDRFARAEYTQRQRDYASRLGQDSVYTPEFILNSLEWRRGWFNGNSIPQFGAKKTGDLALTLHDKEKTISALYLPGSSPSAQPPTFNVALLGFNVITDVKRGENGGRKLEHDFVVLNFISAPMTAGSSQGFQSTPLEIKSSTEVAPGAVVAWVSGADGSILQIAGGWLPGGNLSAK